MRTGILARLGAVQELCTAQYVPQCSWFALQLPGPSTNNSSSQFQQQQQQRQKHTVRMVLLKDHPHLGSKGDIVEVKAGHARHELFPQGLADYAVPSVINEFKERGALSAQALEQLRSGSKRQAAAGAVDPASLPVEQQLPQIIKLLTSKPLVVSRRFSWKQPDQPMVGALSAKQLALYAAKQLHIELPRELILMDDSTPITQFGSYRVPLNLRDEGGRQVELSVQVNKTYRAPGLRRFKLWAQSEGLLPPTPPPQPQQSQPPQPSQ